jgi:hypothetical protein
VRIAGGAVVVVLLLSYSPLRPRINRLRSKRSKGLWDISQRFINLKPGQGEESQGGQ